MIKDNYCSAVYKGLYIQKDSDTEFRLAEILNNNIPDRILYTQKDESCLLDNGGCHKDELRRRIEQQIIENKIPSNNPIIKEFIDGGIW